MLNPFQKPELIEATIVHADAGQIPQQADTPPGRFPTGRGSRSTAFSRVRRSIATGISSSLTSPSDEFSASPPPA